MQGQVLPRLYTQLPCLRPGTHECRMPVRMRVVLEGVPATLAAAPGTGELMPAWRGEGAWLCSPADLDGPSGVRLSSALAAGRAGEDGTWHAASVLDK